MTSDITTTLITPIQLIYGYLNRPLILGPLSEIYGRSHVLQLSNLWYLGWNLGRSFAQLPSKLIAFRLLASLHWRRHHGLQVRTRTERQALVALLGPVLGPICGAWIPERIPGVLWSTNLVHGAIVVASFLPLYEWECHFRSSRLLLILILADNLIDSSTSPLFLAREADIICRAQVDSEKGSAQYSHIRMPFQVLMLVVRTHVPWTIYKHIKAENGGAGRLDHRLRVYLISFIGIIPPLPSD